MRPLDRILLPVLLILPSLTSAQANAGDVSCDPTLMRLAASVNGYQKRGDRCEGIYAKQVAGTALFLASFTGFFEDYDLQSPDTLTVGWPVTPGSGVQLRAETVRGGRYYRMDTVRPPLDSLYRWPNRVLSAERIRKRDLGIVGWTRMRVGDTTRVVFLPLELHQNQVPSCAGYDLVLAPGERLAEVYISLGMVDSTGAATLLSKHALEYGFYPAENPISVHLKPADLPAAGVYYLKVAARLSTGGTSTKEYLLLIAPPAACGT